MVIAAATWALKTSAKTIIIIFITDLLYFAVNKDGPDLRL
jgi:hypothetical protein